MPRGSTRRGQPAKTGEGSQQLDASSHQEHATPFPFDALSAPIAERIRTEGIRSCNDWIDLGPKRKKIFGVVSRQVAAIDQLVVDTMTRAAQHTER